MNMAKGTEFDRIEDLTRCYGAARTLLGDRLAALEAELLATKQRHLRGIRAALAKATDRRDALATEIRGCPERFARPRTVTIDGIRVGLAKGKGKLTWDDPAAVVARIDRHFPAQAETLVKTTRTPIRAALATLTIAELKRLGCRVEETGDEVVIKPQDGELDKLVNRLLADAQGVEDAV